MSNTVDTLYMVSDTALDATSLKICRSCIVCQETVEVPILHGPSAMVCSKCRQAVMLMREQIKLREELLDGYRMMKGEKTEDVSTCSTIQTRNTEEV